MKEIVDPTLAAGAWCSGPEKQATIGPRWPQTITNKLDNAISVRGTLRFTNSLRKTQIHKLTVALRKLGNGYSGKIPYGAGVEGLPSGSY